MVPRSLSSKAASELLRAMLLIRSFEERLLSLPEPGFQLLSSGEEAVAVGLATVLESGDQLLTGGRSIGPALARGIVPEALFAELLGRRTGPCRGKAGRGHLSQPAVGFFGAHAVVAGNVGVAAGVALAHQQRGTARVVVCLFGDGACGAGILHETLNLASLWQLPLVFACNNNQYSVATPVRSALAVGTLADLARPFGIPARVIDGMDLLAVRDAADDAVTRARAGGGPSFLELISYRFHPHSSWSRESRPSAEVAAWRTRCPIARFAERFDLDLATARAHVEEEVARACEAALDAPFPDAAELLADVET